MTVFLVILNLIQDLKHMLLISRDSVLSNLRNDGIFRHPELDSGSQATPTFAEKDSVSSNLPE
jgi:hypothetical protein